MRAPTDRSLASWIRELLDTGQIVRFYKCDEWRELRAEVLRDHHQECSECAKHGKYTRARVVHHVHEVRDRPDLALTRWVREPDGTMTENLVPLCMEHHEMAHGRAYAGRGDAIQAQREAEAEERFPERW